MMITLKEMLPDFFDTVDMDIISEEDMAFPDKHSKRAIRRKEMFRTKKRKKKNAYFKKNKDFERNMFYDVFDLDKHANLVKENSAKMQIKEFYSSSYCEI